MRRSTKYTALYSGVLFLIMIGTARVNFAQNGALRGFISDSESGQGLQGVNVVLRAEGQFMRGGTTDGNGFFALARIPSGQYTIHASYIGYSSFVDTVRVDSDFVYSLSIELSPGETEMDEVVIQSDRISGSIQARAGVQTVRPEDIELIPSPDVSADLINYLTAQPGIVTRGDQGGQLFVRGGEPAHNLALLDGMYVYQPFHILSFYSAFPAEIVSRADVYAGGFGSQFAGRISSVIDVHSRDGNNRVYSGSASVAPFVSGLRIEGPIVHKRVSFLASIRESLIEQGAGLYLDTPLPYRFGDLFGKLNVKITEDHRLAFSLLRTHDRGAVTEGAALDRAMHWTNEAYGLRYLIVPRELPILAEIKGSFSSHESSFGPQSIEQRSSTIQNVNTEVNITNFAPQFEVNWGFYLRSVDVTADLRGLYQDLAFEKDRFTKIGFYIEPVFTLFGSLEIQPGFAGQIFKQEGFIPEPRIRLSWQKDIHQLSAAAGLYHQEIVGLNDRRDATNVFTAWTDAPSDNIARSTHLLVGYRIAPGEVFQASVEGFYKTMDHLSIEEWTAFPRFTAGLQEAAGLAKGIDIRLAFSLPGMRGFVNYGLSHVEYEAMQSSLGLWFGEETLQFRPPHDRRHQVNAAINTTIRQFDVGVRWNFGSGLPFSRALGFDTFSVVDGPVDVKSVPESRRVIYERPYNGILPAYHRLDVSVARTFDFEAVDLTIQASVMNVYDRENLFALDIFTLERTDQLPILPTLGVKATF